LERQPVSYEIEGPRVKRARQETGQMPDSFHKPPPQAPFDWHAYLKVHPAADEYPLLRDIDHERFAAMAEDIRLNGLRAPIIAWSPEGGDNGLAVDAPAVLDGRNRLDILAHLGLLYETPDHHVGLRRWTGSKWSDRGGRIDGEFHHVFGGDPYKICASYNIHRRDLNAEHKRGLIASLLKREPEASNNSIAKRLAVDDKTVAAVRRDLEGRSEIPNVSTRKDTKGRKQPAKKKPAPKKTMKAAAAGNVVENDAEISAEKRKAEHAAADTPPTDTKAETGKPERKGVGAKDIAIDEFDVHVLRLVQMIRGGREPARFIKTSVPGSDLSKLGRFLAEVAEAVKAASSTEEVV
jgi:hypothetical protein